MSTTDEETLPNLPDLSEATCRHCGATGKIRIEVRKELHARPMGSYSLSGAQLKASAVELQWPWAVCDNCGHESRGQQST